jgi:hypothetical protein
VIFTQEQIDAQRNRRELELHIHTSAKVDGNNVALWSQVIPSRAKGRTDLGVYVIVDYVLVNISAYITGFIQRSKVMAYPDGSFRLRVMGYGDAREAVVEALRKEFPGYRFTPFMF